MTQKRTHKFGALGDVAAVVAESKSLTHAARKLGINRSTLHRWIESGKVKVPDKTRARAGAEQPPEDLAPEHWAEWVRKNFELSATDLQLVDLARIALVQARDEQGQPNVRLNAMGRFQNIVKQLNLDDEGSRQATEVSRNPTPEVPRRTGTHDPRTLLMAVK